MAVETKDITREIVQKWIDKYKGEPGDTLEAYIRRMITALNIPDPVVNTEERDGLGDETHIADMIIADLDSYAR